VEDYKERDTAGKGEEGKGLGLGEVQSDTGK
jgi:hypothetical protein